MTTTDSRSDGTEKPSRGGGLSARPRKTTKPPTKPAKSAKPGTTGKAAKPAKPAKPGTTGAAAKTAKTATTGKPQPPRRRAAARSAGPIKRRARMAWRRFRPLARRVRSRVGLQGAVALAVLAALGMMGVAALVTKSSRSLIPGTSMSGLRAAPVTRSQVLARALLWHPHSARRVPYSQSKVYEGYRTDCSGYASMTLGLGGGIDAPNTQTLVTAAYSTPIAMSALQPGDLVIDAVGDNNERHAVIFEKWANPAHSAYWEYEQRGRYGTDHTIRTYGLPKGSSFHAYRPRNLVDDAPPGQYQAITFAPAPAYHAATTRTRVGTLPAGRHRVYCKRQGPEVGSAARHNRYWLRTDLNGKHVYVSAYYLYEWGTDQATALGGTPIPTC